MKIFDIEQLAKADKVTIEKQKISSTELMERAATLVFNDIHSKLNGAQIPIKIFCGIGNNGGDGLVIGRLLLEHGYQVIAYVVNYSNKRSQDFLLNYDRIKEVSNNWPSAIKGEDDFPEISEKDFIIDAIFGIGLNRPLEDWVGKLVQHINRSKAFIVAIDMPSGMFADKMPNENRPAIKANVTITFQTPKLIFFLPQAAEYIGDMQVIDIGLDREYLAKTAVNKQLINKPEAQLLYKPRINFAHKGDYGHVLIIGGSYGKIGSISLTAKATLKTGAGMVTIFSPKCGYQILQSILPEAMVITDENEETLSNIEFDLSPDVICFGMGAGTSKETTAAFKDLLINTKKPMVIDADGINILSKEKELIKELPENTVLTPHPGELERLIGKWEDDFDKLEKVKKFSKKHKLIVVIKGAHTITVFKDDLYINNTGNPGMATAGSGDVLSGVITSLISQQYEPLIAAVFGVYLHGKTGDILAEEMSYEGLIAGDIADSIGRSFLDLFKKEM
ncbi:NAD(P)H-hydrate dehydratase [Gillisia sp. JM1]|uniref:NAD(P)H-hydrate dehydratase n=1 Tax=Gillisia sp. JM1 TaxID=1283286 RepID=UPI00040B22EC|nr:NAD(P)H-hydrate dehydratase [Gillisia sp. JM1]